MAPAKASCRTRSRWACLSEMIKRHAQDVGTGIVPHDEAINMTPVTCLPVKICLPFGITSLLWISFIAGCTSPQTVRPLPAVSAPNLRVMTYNVNFAGSRMDLAVSAIREADADLVCLQETTPAWETLLRRQLSEIYPHMQFRTSGGAGGQAILSKYEIEGIAYVRETPGWFPGWIVKAKTSLGLVQVVNVHLRPPLSERGSVTASAYFGTGSIRREEVRLLSQKLDPQAAMIVTGDFNENDSGKAVSWLRERGFIDALR